MEKNYCDGGEAILEALRSLATDYIIASPGSEWSPVWEALARQKVGNKKGPGYIDCWHETLAVDMAIGYTQITGRPQAVLVHAGAGLLQGTAGIHSAQLAEIPMVIMSGESQSYGEDPDLDIEPQWYGSLSIVGGPHRLVEPIAKLANQATSPHTLYQSVVRAVEYAQRTPKGPVYLTVPLETMLHEWSAPAKLAKVPPVPKTQAATEEIENLAALLVGAKTPMIVAESSGRDPNAFTALVELAELLAIPLLASRNANYANFPNDHPLYLGTDLARLVPQSDLVLLVGSRAPWYPPSKRLTTGAIVAIHENPLKGQMVYQNLQADSYLEGDIATSLRLLTEMLRAAKLDNARIAERRERWTREHERLVRDLRAAEAKAQGETPVDPVTLLAALGAALPPDTIYVDETITHAGLLRQHLPLNRPQTYFRTGGGLGQGLGVALGAKLAAPERPVVLIVGDGSFLYNPVVQAFGASRTYKLPILVVVMNNGRYQAMKQGHLHHYRDGAAVSADLFYGVHIDGPDYAELGKPFGFHGQKVGEPGELKAAIGSAYEAVKGGRTAILNVALSR